MDDRKRRRNDTGNELSPETRRRVEGDPELQDEVPWQHTDNDSEIDDYTTQSDSEIKEHISGYYVKLFGRVTTNPFHVATSVMNCTDLEKLNKIEMHKEAKGVKVRVLSLYLEYQRRKTVSNVYSEEERSNLEQKMKKILHIIHLSELLIKSACEIKDVIALGDGSGLSDDMGLFRFMPIAEEENTSFQNLVLYLLTMAFHKKYRKLGDQCWEQIRTSENVPTHAWQVVCTIKDFILESTNKELQFHQWKNLTSSKGTIREANEYLISSKDPEFPELVLDRHVFSFSNGIYNTEDDMFYPFDTKPLPSTVVACNYFDMEFDFHSDLQGTLQTGDWYWIDTPNFQMLLDHQEFSEEESRWIYAFLGRVLYEVNEIDGWQVIPFFKGKAGTGKSTILQCVEKLFPTELVGIMSNNMEKKFGLSALVDSLLFLAYEVKNDFSLDQAEFQCITSGEPMMISKKHQTAMKKRWTSPGVLAGNEVPKWVDNSGSIVRRVIPFEMTKTVVSADTTLGIKLRQEIPKFILKINRAYRSAVNHVSTKDIWKCLPQKFRRAQTGMGEQTNALINFLNSGKLDYSDSSYIPLQEFSSALKQHCVEIGFPFPRFNSDFYSAPFSQKNITVTDMPMRWEYPPNCGVIKHTRYIQGMDVASTT